MLRIDDRLIHGQVCVGWCLTLGIRRIVLCDDDVAGSDFERGLYECCPAPDQVLEFVRIAELAPRLNEAPELLTMVVLASPAGALDLTHAGARIEEIVLGGLHDRPGARRYLDYVYLTADQERDLRTLLDRGVKVICRALPSTCAVNLKKLLK